MTRVSGDLNDFHRRRAIYLNWGSNRAPGEIPTGEVAQIQAELIDLLRMRDDNFGADALWALLHGMTADLAATISRKVHPQVAADVVHDVLSSLAKDYQAGKLNLDLERGAASFASALRRAAQFTIADYYKRPAARESAAGTAASIIDEQEAHQQPDLDDQLGGAELQQWLMEVIRPFDAAQRLLVFGELTNPPITPAEQAVVLGISQDLRNTRAAAARKKIRGAFATMYTVRQQRIVTDGAATGCRGLTDELDKERFARFAPFTADMQVLVTKHIKTCSNCQTLHLELAGLSYDGMLRRFKGALNLPMLLTPRLVEPWARQQQDAADRNRLAELAAAVSPPTRDTAHPDPSPSSDVTSNADLVDRTGTAAPAALAGAAPSMLPPMAPLKIGQQIQNGVQKLLLPGKTAAVKLNTLFYSALPGGAHSARGLSTAAVLVVGGTLALVSGSDSRAAAQPDPATITTPTTATTTRDPTLSPTTPSPTELSTAPQPSPSGANVPRAPSSPPPTGPTPQPTTDPITRPTTQPTIKPTIRPTKQPTTGPTGRPTTGPAVPPPAQPPAAPRDLSGGMSLLFTNMNWLPGQQRSWSIALTRWPASKCPTADPCYVGSTPWKTAPDGHDETSNFVLTIRRAGSRLVVEGTDKGWPPETDQRYTGTDTGNLTFTGTFREFSTNRTADMTLQSCVTHPDAPACNLLP